MKTALTIAGSDCSGGAGIQADIKTMSALGVYATSVITSIVAENTLGVISCENVSANSVADQLEAIFSDIKIDAVKIGMINSYECMEVVVRKLKKYAPKIIIIDPVLKATDGTYLIKDSEYYKRTILPLATLATPNIPEAEWLIGRKINDVEDMKKAAKTIISLGTKAALIKGGHLNGDAIDILYDGTKYFTYTRSRINSSNTHGTGCTLSSAIAAYMARGSSLDEAVAKAKNYITEAIKDGLNIGRGHGPTNHFFEFYNAEGERK